MLIPYTKNCFGGLAPGITFQALHFNLKSQTEAAYTKCCIPRETCKSSVKRGDASMSLKLKC